MPPSAVPCAKCNGEVFGKQVTVSCSSCNNKCHAKCYDVVPADVLAFQATFICEVCRRRRNADTPVSQRLTPTVNTVPVAAMSSPKATACDLPLDLVQGLDECFAIDSSFRSSSRSIVDKLLSQVVFLGSQLNDAYGELKACNELVRNVSNEVNVLRTDIKELRQENTSIKSLISELPRSAKLKQSTICPVNIEQLEEDHSAVFLDAALPISTSQTEVQGPSASQSSFAWTEVVRLLVLLKWDLEILLSP